MLALAASSASSVSLLLNLESVFTALLAWFVFRENFDRRLVLGMSLIVCGGAIFGGGAGGVGRAPPPRPGGRGRLGLGPGNKPPRDIFPAGHLQKHPIQS